MSKFIYIKSAKHCITCCLFIMAVLLASRISGQQNKLNFKHYSINEGLSQNTVFCLLEDRDGLIWIGTEDGLNMFDGYNFTYYKHEFRNPGSISHNQINALYEDRQGQIWIGTSDGLNILNKKTGKITHLSTKEDSALSINDFITSIYEDSKRNIWITSIEGLKRYNPVTQKFVLYNHGPLRKRADKVLEDTHGIFWVSIDKDLRRFDPKSSKFLPLPAVLENNQELRNSFIRVLKQDNTGKIWIGTEKSGLFVFDEKTNILQHFREEKSDAGSLAANIVREIFFMDADHVWIGTRDGLSVYDRSTNKFTSYRNDRYDPGSLSMNSIREIIKDRAGNVWLGTFSGGVNLLINRHNMFQFMGYETPSQPGLSHNMVSSVIGTESGELWIGTEGGGLNLYDRNTDSFSKYALPRISANLGANTIKCILPEGGNLWLGTVDGLYYFDHAHKSMTQIPIPFYNSKEIVSMVKADGKLWLATHGSGLYARDAKGGITSYRAGPSKNSLPDNELLKIVKDESDNLWIASNKGLCYFSNGKFTPFFHNQSDLSSISNNSISTLFIDSKKRIWIGTKGGGINLYDSATNRFYVIDKTTGLTNDYIQAIKEDNKGHLWVSTNQGLSKIVIKAAPPFTTKSVQISNYFVEDGLQSNQFLPNSSYKSKTWELYFGGINGLTYFNPDSIKSNPYRPPVILTSFLIRNKVMDVFSENSPLKVSINETKEITLTHDQAFITFRFAALNFVNPTKNKYAYKLEGFKPDEDWHYVGGQREANYTNLDAGEYVFMVKAANNDGLWNDTPKTISITILPPWWKTWWAYALYILIIGSLLMLYYRYSLRTAKLKNALDYEHLIRQKDSELHQRKLNFFTNISHEIKTPLTLILAPLEKLLGMNQDNKRVQHQLMLMKKSGDKLMRLINQLLDFRKFDSGNMVLQAAEDNLVKYIKEIVAAFDQYAHNQSIKLQVETDKKSIKAWFDKDKLEKILYNLIFNALKFTSAGGEITIRIKELQVKTPELRTDFIQIEVEDNGVGIAADKIPTLFDPFTSYDQKDSSLQGSGIGLAFTKSLVELHHGEITVESTPGNEEQQPKTRFTFQFPVGPGHLKASEIMKVVRDEENIDAYVVNDPIMERSAGMDVRIGKILSDDEEAPLMLIVEDNKEVMTFLNENFSDQFKIETAVNGKEGIDKAINSLPDIIISDVMMPEVSGTVLCSILKTDNRTSHIPIILLTAKSQIIHELEGLETGADDYITKPFSTRILEAKVWNLLEQRRLLRERYRQEITLQPQNIAITSPDEEFLKKVMDYIELNIMETTLNVEDLAREVFMSRTTLYRKIKALTNKTTVEFIRTVKLKRAAQLLKSNSYTVKEVTYMAGFNDIDYFRKCFKELYNKTPTEYINS